MTRSLAPLRHRSFRCLVAGQFASNLGDACYAVALPWYVLAEHGGPLLLGTVLAAYGVPRTVALAFGGHASDRWRPWTVMMGSDVVRAICTAALAAAAALGPARTVILVPIAVVLGAGEGLFLPGSFAIVPTLLPDADLQAGNALTSGGTQLAMLAGPGSGGCPGGARWPGACLRDRRGLLRRVSGDAGRRPRGPGSRPSGAGHSGGSGRAGSCRCPGPGTCACRGTGRTGADAARATPLPAGAPDHAACHRRGQPGIRRARRRSDPVAGPWAAAHERGGLRRADRRFRRRRPAGHRRRRAGPPGATARHRGLGCLPGRGAVPRRCPVSRRRRPGRRRAGRHRGHERIRQRRHDHRFPALGTPGPAGPADWPAAAGELRGLPRLRGTRCPGGA